MQPARATARGGLAIHDWTTHCPACGQPVTVPKGREAVACPHCKAAFAPEGLQTTAGPKPTRAPKSHGDPQDPLVGTTLGRWRLVRRIGQGGMGTVYEARDERGARRAALKVLSADLASDPSFRKRFHREARVLGELSHPHVVEVIDRGEEDGQLFFAMEYVRGENLRRRMEQGPLAPDEAVRITGEIASALAYAHARGVIHRDLKPENVLLDEEGRVHLADFGLSRLVQDKSRPETTLLTRTDVILGTYEYMAPEQRLGDKDLDGRADVFALGVMLYEMLTGQLPHGRFEPPSHVRSSVPSSVNEVVNRALARERDARYASADAMKQALNEAWSQRRRRGRAKPAVARKAPRPATRDLTDEEIRALKPALRHVDIAVAIDRVLGVVLLLVSLGIVSHRTIDDLIWLQPVGGVLLLIGSILLLRQAGKLSRMSEGSREGQVVASALLLFLFPLGTAAGIYGLIVFTGDAAREAFRAGRKALEGPQPVVVRKVVEVERRPARRGAPPWMHLLVFAALLWALYAAIVILRTNVPDTSLLEALETMDPTRMLALKVSMAGVLMSVVASVAAFRARRVRRGFGMALTAFVVFASCAWVLAGLHTVTRITPDAGLILPTVNRVLPSLPSTPSLEIRR